MEHACCVGYFKGVKYKDFRTLQGIKGNMLCKMWSCPTCRPNLVKKLRARLLNGEMMNHFTNGSRYQAKFLTLTCPGRAFRSANSPEQAYKLMSKSFRKLMKALAKFYGGFHYLRVVEAQRDGYPHYHVLLVGKGIESKNILNSIRELWCYKYGLGNIDLKLITSIKHGINYITKYMLKSEGVFMKKGHKFSASKDALQKKQKVTWLEKKFYMGVVRKGAEGAITIEQRELDPLSPLFDWDIEGFIERFMRNDDTPF